MTSFFPDHGDARVTVKIIIGVLSAVIDQQVFFFVDKLQDIALARFEMGRQLDGKGRARLLAESSVDAAGEIDAKPSRVAASICPLGRLHRDTIDWADS